MQRSSRTVGATAPCLGVTLLVAALGGCGGSDAAKGATGGNAGGGTGSGIGGSVGGGGNGSGGGGHGGSGGSGQGGSGGAGGAGGDGAGGNAAGGSSMGSGGSQPVPLTPAEVTGVGPGDAQGKTYAGLYASDAWGPNLCACRTGSCQDIRYNVFAIVGFSQSDGSLSMERVRGYFREAICSGGVDQTGRFWCAAAAGSNLFLMTGQFSTTAGVPTSMSMTARETVRGDDGRGQIVDCDIEQSETFLFLQ